MENSFRSHVLSGISWSVTARIADQIVRFVVSILLARLLLPEDFGIIGMVMVFVGFAVWIGDAGFGAAIIQRKELTEQHIQTVFWVNIGIGIIISMIVFVSAPFIAHLYKMPLLRPLTQIISLSFLISSPGMVSAALLQRRMVFREIAIINTFSTLISGIVGICFALYGMGTWSLIAQMFTHISMKTILNIYFARWLPQLKFSYVALRDLWGYTVNLLGYNMFNYWAKNVDNLLIGRIFGAEWLGYYTRSYALMLMPFFQGVSVISNVIFPALSTIQDDHVRVKQIYLRAISIISLLVCPTMLGLIVVAEPFILTIYGENWSLMIPLVQILAPVGIFQSLSVGGWIYMSQGRTDWMFRWGFARTIVYISSILIGIVIGSVEAVAWCYAIANVLIFYPDTAIPGRLINMRFSEVLGVIAIPFIGSVMMVCAVLLTNQVIPSYWPIWGRLFLSIGIGGLFYFIYILYTRPIGWVEVTVLIRKRRQSPVT